ncbi:MAG: glycosyltransferase family 39 protein [Candidatus Omnitrophota bacterium]
MAWRIHLGQKPFVDFTTYVGPVHSYWMAFFFGVFGFGRLAIWACAFSTAAVAITATYLVIRKEVPAFAAVAALAVTTAGFNWAFSHPFYTHTAQAIGLIATAVLILTMRSQNTSRHPNRLRLAWGLCGFAAVVSFLTKPNVGACYGLMFTLTALLTPKSRLIAVAWTAAGAMTALAAASWWWIADWDLFIRQTILEYGTLTSSRAVEALTNWHPWTMNYYWIIGLIVLASCLAKKTFPRPGIFLFCGLYFIGIFEMATSGAVWESNVPVIGLYLALAYRLLYANTPLKNRTLWRRRITGGLVCLITCIAIYLTGLFTDYGLKIKQWRTPDRRFKGVSIDPIGTYPLRTAALKGWLAEGYQGRAFDDLADYIRSNIAPSDRLMILTDLSLINAATGRLPLKGVPGVWTVDYSPPPGKPVEDLRHSFENNPPEWVLTHIGGRLFSGVAFLGDLIEYLGLERILEKYYALVFRSGNYIILRRIR